MIGRKIYTILSMCAGSSLEYTSCESFVGARNKKHEEDT